MKSGKKNKKPWLQSFEKKWQRVLVVILLVIFVACMTITVLLGVEMLIARNEEPVSTASPAISSTASATVMPTGAALTLTDDAGRSYTDSTLFLGDSNTVRFMTYLDSDGETFTSDQNTIAVVGMGVQAIDTLSCEQMSTGTYTMTESVPILQPERIIITFGTNNLDGKTTDTTDFIKDYTAQLKEIQEAYPSVDIIVNSIPPLAIANDYPKLSISQIKLYNKAILAMCEKNDWKFLNSYEALADSESGYAKDGYMASDGLHLSQTGMEALFKYIRTHAYITTDDRPKPLSEIPTIYGPLTTLYNVNPLNDQSYSSDVLNPTPQPASTAAAAETPVPQVTEAPAQEPAATEAANNQAETPAVTQ